MSRRSLGFLAVTLIVLMGIVATAGLDNLPRELRHSIESAQSRLNSDRSTFVERRADLERTLAAEPELFASRKEQWAGRLDRAQSRLAAAVAEAATLDQLAKANRRTDSDKARASLSKLEQLRTQADGDLNVVRSEAQRWLSYKRDLPKRLEQMQSQADAIRTFDPESATARVQKAIVDWPAKKDDLQARVTALATLKEQGLKTWESTAGERQKATANDVAHLDYATLFDSADKLDQTAKQLKDDAEADNRLADQLYSSWDKVLVQTEQQNGHRRLVRTIRTTYPDATLQNPSVSKEDRWEDIDASQFEKAERNEGMVVARKAAGKYDSEAEQVVQPPAYAYVAPPGQSNAYGSWNNGVWNWLPQYLILSQLLQSGSRYPVTSGDFDAYQNARRRGDTWYGPYGSSGRGWYRHRDGGSRSGAGSAVGRALEALRDSGSRADSGRSSGGGGFWKERGKPSFGGGGGFQGSRYQSRGTFSGSRYRSRGGFSSGGSFGSRSYSRGIMRGLSRGRR